MSLSNESKTPIDFDRVLLGQEKVIETFRAFRSELLSSYGNVGGVKKPDGSLVTELDRKVETVLKEQLAELTPEFGFKGEEFGQTGDTGSYWVVDPIDGTTSFIRGTDRCTNMAAFMHDSEPVAAVIYDFPRDYMYTAVKGMGSFCNGKKLKVSESPVEGSYVDNEVAQTYAEMFNILSPEGVRVFQPLGASGASFVDVASGKSEGYLVIGRDAYEHDVMPGLLIAKEAGAELVTRSGSPDWREGEGDFVIANPAIAAFFRDQVFADKS